MSFAVIILSMQRDTQLTDRYNKKSWFSVLDNSGCSWKSCCKWANLGKQTINPVILFFLLRFSFQVSESNCVSMRNSLHNNPTQRRIWNSKETQQDHSRIWNEFVVLVQWQKIKSPLLCSEIHIFFIVISKLHREHTCCNLVWGASILRPALWGGGRRRKLGINICRLFQDDTN
jgi:hypothetical protein